MVDRIVIGCRKVIFWRVVIVVISGVICKRGNGLILLCIDFLGLFVCFFIYNEIFDNWFNFNNILILKFKDVSRFYFIYVLNG